MTLQLLVFSDLDGTLLSHADYRWDAAKPALQALRRIGAGVVLASSKTAPELLALRADLGLEDWPLIVENGAGLLPAHSVNLPNRSQYHALRQILVDLPRELCAPFRGFGDMTSIEISDLTGLDPDAATRAAERAFSEPGIWSGPDASRDAFLRALGAKGVTAHQGGRFLTLSFGQTKADQMAAIIAKYAPNQTVALGDAPNDIEMLNAAGTGIIVANPQGNPLPALEGERSGRIIRTDLPGPEGWNAAMLDLLKQRALT